MKLELECKTPRQPITSVASQCNQDSGILGQGSTFFVREILEGIGAKPGGAYHHYFKLLPVGCLRPRNMLYM